MKELTTKQLAEVNSNLDNYFALATDKDIDSGIAWYKQAHYICKDLAERYNTKLETVASIISALSPRNRWPQNIKDTKTVLDAIHSGLSPNQVKVCTFHKNKEKAFLLAKEQTSITEKSLKTFSFVNNIAKLDKASITIDVWHLRACFGKTVRSTPSRKAYDQIRLLTIEKAKQKGLNGYEYQAIIWNSVKNNFNN
jgi:hypothetical protein